MNGSFSAMVFGALLVSARCLSADYHVVTEFEEGVVPRWLTPFGPNVTRTYRFDDRGMVFELAADRRDVGPTGVFLNVPLSGEFEVTLDYEVITVEPVYAGLGSGVKMWGQFAGDRTGSVGFGHFFRWAGEGQWIAIVRLSMGIDSLADRRESLASNDRRGRLRFARQGDQLIYQAAAADSDDFKTVLTHVAPTGPLQPLRISANTGKEAVSLAIRLERLEVRSDGRHASTAVEPVLAWSLTAGTLALLLAAIICQLSQKPFILATEEE